MLSHPWVAEGGAANDGRSLEPEVLLRLKRFAAAGRLQQAALKVCWHSRRRGHVCHTWEKAVFFVVLQACLLQHGELTKIRSSIRVQKGNRRNANRLTRGRTPILNTAILSWLFEVPTSCTRPAYKRLLKNAHQPAYQTCKIQECSHLTKRVSKTETQHMRQQQHSVD
jgi:hypothetical protein